MHNVGDLYSATHQVHRDATEAEACLDVLATSHNEVEDDARVADEHSHDRSSLESE